MHSPPPQTSPSRIVKAFISLGCLFLACFANNFALAWVNQRYPNYPPLPDIVFEAIPQMPWALQMAEMCIVICALSAVITMFTHADRCLVFSRVFYITALLYFGRFVCVVVTQLPLPNRHQYCEPRIANETEPTLWVLLLRSIKGIRAVGLETSGFRQYCGDLIYSGHTIVLVVSYHTTKTYLPKHSRAISNVIWVLMLIGMFGILASRLHYTIDVVLAYYISSRVYCWYHVVANNPSTRLEEVEHADIISRLFWFPFVAFIEDWPKDLSLPSYLPVTTFSYGPKPCWPDPSERNLQND